MSTSSRILGDTEILKYGAQVFLSPNELSFSTRKRRTFLTIFNPYGCDAQFKILTPNPDRFDVSLSKGTIKPSRRIDISIRLVNSEIDKLPEPTDEPQIVDYFRITIQAGPIRGHRQVKVYWSVLADYSDIDESKVHSLTDDKTQKVKVKSSKQPLLSPGPANFSASYNQRTSTQQARSAGTRSRSQPATDRSSINLICFLCAIVCVVPLFLPLAIDSELCKKANLYAENDTSQPTGILTELANFLSVSYEMKFGCSFALGLFTYRLISTMPD